jgi:hypothetical protein
MPRARGKANYKVELLIEVVEEKLPQGALGWQEVAALYQFRSQESVLRDYEDVKRHWTEKLTGDQPASTAKKQKKRRSEDISPTPIPNQKTKNSSSEKRGSIVKSIDTLVKTIATDESDNKQASAASAAAFSQMQMQMQMQQMSFAMQQQMQEM